jgi:hypothetical protein
MDAGSESLPDDIGELKAALVVARAEVAAARAQRSDDQALIAHLKRKHPVSTAVTPAAGVLLRAYATNA